MLLLLCMLLVATAIANPVIKTEPKPINDDSIINAVDFTQVATQQQFNCLANYGYKIAFVRAYSPAGQGTFDPNSITNVINSFYGFQGLEVYISPNATGGKSGAQQTLETYNGLTNGGLWVGVLWLQVTNPSQWSTSHSSNIKFIQSYMSEVKSLISPAGLYGGGIYTSLSDWTSITGGWSGASSLRLWYANVHGNGTINESPPNYNDFTPFGGWKTPDAKQYGQRESLCGISPLNRDVCTRSSLISKDMAKLDGRPVVGRNFKY